jgi:hypothetical protein
MAVKRTNTRKEFTLTAHDMVHRATGSRPAEPESMKPREVAPKTIKGATKKVSQKN